MVSNLASRPLRRLLTRRPILAHHFHRTSVWATRKIIQPFKLADIGEGITECEVIKWNVKPSSNVQLFDPLCEVQSDKASVEITSPFEGVVKELLVREGQVAKVGEDLCMIEVVDESSEEPGAADATMNEDIVEQATSVHEPGTSSSEQSMPASTSSGVERNLHPLDPRAQAEHKSEPLSVLALPSVRHFAKERGVDLTHLAPGSGKGGRVEKKDVEEFLARASSQGSTHLAGPSIQERADNEVVVELGRTRHAMWKAMAKSLEIPHFGYSTYLDLTSLHNVIPVLNAYIPPHYLLEPPPEKPMAVSPSSVHPVPPPPEVPPTARFSRLTYLPFLLKTLAIAMHEWPLFRSSITPFSTNSETKPTLTIRPHADISIALSTPSGLYTPTLQRVSSHSVYSLASRLAHLSALGRRMPCGLGPAEMPKAGGTLTVSNVGALGNGEFASPVLVPGGGVAIVAIGRAKWTRDEERNGERRLKVGVSWSADHRIVEGAELAAFVECWRGYIEHPERLIGIGV
ncbi:CoA-dependent acyltransferase [Fomitiporia mediterranea MF3/22]|uniref:CoA-dependent acyltransferase n=1 Tax=Fomitiporia mediterranea (strain MF3/22) TaxID=694068 RepID=UPI000440772D|nr:CoA-dependent acyltransferase [Fomitiporia mediterranea MF3/22]EJD04583.1 CoA-dependent acyltransferase [Fomitiporia mediterranea MF3/22]